MKTNIGKCFFHLINKYFSQEHKFYKIFNKNALKLSYSCMPNLKILINNHNQDIHKDQRQSTPKSCICSKKMDCLVNGLRLTESLLYYTTISCNKENYTKLYKVIYETTFKKHNSNHKNCFTVPTYKDDTKLSTKYWVLKAKQPNSKSWWIKRRYNS